MKKWKMFLHRTSSICPAGIEHFLGWSVQCKYCAQCQALQLPCRQGCQWGIPLPTDTGPLYGDCSCLFLGHFGLLIPVHLVAVLSDDCCHVLHTLCAKRDNNHQTIRQPSAPESTDRSDQETRNFFFTSQCHSYSSCWGCFGWRLQCVRWHWFFRVMLIKNQLVGGRYGRCWSDIPVVWCKCFYCRILLLSLIAVFRCARYFRPSKWPISLSLSMHFRTKGLHLKTIIHYYKCLSAFC